MKRRLRFLPGLIVLAYWTAGPPHAHAAQPAPAAAGKERPDGSAEAAKAGYAAAAALQNRGEWDLAAEEWEALLKRFPKDPLAAKGGYYLGICRLKQGRFADAATGFEQAIAAKPDAETRALAEFELGRALYSRARAEAAGARDGRKEIFQRAAEALGRFASGHPKHPKALDSRVLEAESLWQAGQRSEAVERWTTLVGDDVDETKLPEVLYALGVGLAELGRKGEARAAFDRFAKRFPEHRLARDVAIWRSDLMLEASRPDEAATLLASLAMKDAGRTPEVLERLARAQYLQKKPLEAAAAYAELARMHPDAPAAKRAAMAAAIAYRDGKDTAAAREWFAKVDAAGGPRADEAAHELALLEIEASNPKAALAIADRSLARKPSDTMSPWLMLDRADALWAMPDRRAEAAEAYAKLAKTHPKDAAAATATAMASQAMLVAAADKAKAGDTAAAISLLERLVKEFPDTERIDRAWYRLGELRERAGRHEAAIEAFEACRRVKPDGDREAMALLAIGWAHDALGRPAEAAKAWTTLIGRFPESESAASAHLARGDQRHRAGELKGALSDARSALAGKLPKEAVCEARLLESLCLVGDGRAAEAVPVLLRLRGEMPKDFPAADRVLFELAMARLSLGETATAGKDLAELVKRFPKSDHGADAWLELGELAWDDGDWQRAGEAFSKAVEAGPRADVLEQAAHRLGWSAVMRKDHAAAVRGFERQLAASPHGPLSADGRCMLGESLFKQEQYDRAAEAFARAIEDSARLSSDDFRGLALLRASDCAARASKFEESLKLSKTLLERLPDSSYAPQARYAVGWALQKLGRLDEAIEQYRGIADASRTELAARARLMEGEALFEKGQHAEAIKAFFKAAYGYGERAAPPEYHPWQAQATFEAARCFEAIGKPAQARKLYSELVDRYPDSQQAPAARHRLEALGAS